jgi:flagellar basal-body rod protein FlgC
LPPTILPIVATEKTSGADYDKRMTSILSIATSGMAAAARRLEASARNVANARSDGPLPSADATVKAQYPSAYSPPRVDQVETDGGGTIANVRRNSPSHARSYDPNAPYADSRGMVASPNVDLADEAVQQMVSQHTLVANAQVARVYARMMKSLLDITT